MIGKWMHLNLYIFLITTSNGNDSFEDEVPFRINPRADSKERDLQNKILGLTTFITSPVI